MSPKQQYKNGFNSENTGLLMPKNENVISTKGMKE
jgi:hypothetical protein